jgi:hypothetical protein
LAAEVGAAGAWVDAAGGGVVAAGSGRVARLLESGLMTLGAGFDASGPCGVSGFIDLVACAAFGSDVAPVGAVCANAAAVASAMRTAAEYPTTDDGDRRDMCMLLGGVDRIQ